MRMPTIFAILVCMAGGDVAGAAPPAIGPGARAMPVHRPMAAKKAKHPRRPAAAPHPRGDFERRPAAVAAAGGSCEILRAPDPEDDMAYALWAAHIDSPRHATRAMWDRFDQQPVFFRMARAALAICGARATTASVPEATK